MSNQIKTNLWVEITPSKRFSYDEDEWLYKTSRFFTTENNSQRLDFYVIYSLIRESLDETSPIQDMFAKHLLETGNNPIESEVFKILSKCPLPGAGIKKFEQEKYQKLWSKIFNELCKYKARLRCYSLKDYPWELMGCY